MVGRIKDSLDLDRLSNRQFLVPFCQIPCSLKNPDIILHPEDFAKRQNLPPPAPGRIQPAQDYEVDRAVGMVDVSWSQGIPGIVEDDINKDPRYNQYPYHKGDDLDYEEDMDVEEAPTADTGTSTSRVSHRPGAEYKVDGGESTPGITPRSTHTDTDAAADLDTLQVGTHHPEYHHVVPSDEPRNVFGTVSQTDPVAAFTMSVGQVTAKLVSAQIFGRFRDTMTTGRERPAQSADVTDDAERALRERILQQQLAQAQLPEGAKRESVFQRLGGRAGEGQLQVWPEMTPQKVERGRQPGRGSDMSNRPASCSQSGQKRRSTSQARDGVDSKKGKTDPGPVGASGGKDQRVLVSIDWSNTAIKDQTPKSSQHPTFKPDRSGTTKSPPEPKVKSAVVTKGSSTGSTKAVETSRRCSQTPAQSPKKKNEKSRKPPGFKSKDREPTEKELVRDQAHHWIATRANRLDPLGYVEETRSL